MIEFLPAYRKYRISKKKIEVQVLNTTVIASGYEGRDPQEGTSDGSMLQILF